MKKLRFLVLMPLLMAFQCDDEISHTNENDNLYDTRLLGYWEIVEEVENGDMSDMQPKCCLFVDFLIDSNPDDLQGDYRYTDESGVDDGKFTVNRTENQIIFNNAENEQLIYEYSIYDSGDKLTFTFTENDSEIIQNWTKNY